MRKRICTAAAILAAASLTFGTVALAGDCCHETEDAVTGENSALTGSSAETENGTEAEDSTEAAGNTEIKWHVQIPGKSGSLCNSPTYIAYEKGFFAQEGVDAELISADSETRKIGLNNGTIPTVNGDFQFFPSIENGVETSVVLGLHDGCIKLVVNPDSDIQSVADLKGKKIGVDEIGGTPYQVASVALEQAGIKADSAAGEVTFLPFNDGSLELQALYNNEIDVAAMWDPLGSVAEKDGKVRTILDISKDEPFAGHYCCFIYASNKVLKEQPELIAAEVRAYQKAQDWVHNHPDETADIVTEKGYVSIEDHDLAVQLLKSYNYPTLEDYEKNGTASAKEDVKYFAEQLNKIGYLKTDAAEFADKAYAEVDTTLGQ